MGLFLILLIVLINPMVTVILLSSYLNYRDNKREKIKNK